MKRVLALGVSSILGAGVLSTLPPTTLAQAQSESEARQAFELNTIDVVERYGPSVVSVSVTAAGTSSEENQQLEDFFNQAPPGLRDLLPDLPENEQEQPLQGEGSGFVIDDDGRILTNLHVVLEALQESSVELTEGSSVTVTFSNTDEELPVNIVGANELYDLALLELQDPEALPEGVEPIPLADSDSLQIGQQAIAIGNPFGFEFSVSSGIVSALSRDQQSIGAVNVPYVQTDAAINPGNSGGPLLNSQGEVIGVNTAIISNGGGNPFGSAGNLGIGFAVPSNIVSDALASLEEGGFASLDTRPRLGIVITSIADLPEEARSTFDLPEAGVLIQEVQPGSAADQAGLQGGDMEVTLPDVPTPLLVGGDVITSIDGQPVTDSGELQTIILNRSGDEPVSITYVRDGEERTVEVELKVTERPNVGAAPQAPQAPGTPEGN